MLIIVLWAMGFGLCAAAAPALVREIRRNPWGTCAMCAPGIAGFSVYPILNFVAFAVALHAIEKDKES